MRIRTAHEGEVAALEALLAAAFRDYLAGIGRKTVSKGWLASHVARGDVYIAGFEEPLGLLALSRDEAGRAVTVDMLAVNPALQGQGVGGGLLAHAEAMARDAGYAVLRLHTVAKYGHLIRFYERAGFAVTHLGPRPKGDDGHPRAFLRKTLDSGVAAA